MPAATDTPRFSDGRLHERELTPAPIPDYPFAAAPTPDIATKTYERHYLVRRARYAPKIANRPAGHPETDVDDATAYLVEESSPAVLNSRYATVRRLFAHVPGDQVEPDSRDYARPALHDLVVNGTYAVSFDDGLTSHLFFSRLSTGLALAAPAANTKGIAGGTTREAQARTPRTFGSYLITGKFDGSTFSFVTTADAASIKSTIETGGGSGTVFVSKSPTEIIIQATSGNLEYVNCTDANIEITGSGSGCNIKRRQDDAAYDASEDTPSITETYNAPASLRSLTLTGHGGVAGDRVALWNGSRLVATSTLIAAPTVDTFTIPLDDLPGKDTVVTHAQFAKNGLRLVNGVKDCSLKRTAAYYLPGVTTGLSTALDIPPVPLFVDPIAWLGRILATTHTSATAAAATDRISKTAHGLATGETFFLLAIASGAAGLAILTQYWAIRVDADNLKPAATAALARAGTPIDITSDGTGLTILVPAPWVAIAVTRLEAWHGPILRKTRDELELADALETRAPTA